MNDGKMPGRPTARMLSGSWQAKPDVTLSISSRGVDDAPRQMSEEVEKNRGTRRVEQWRGIAFRFGTKKVHSGICRICKPSNDTFRSGLLWWHISESCSKYMV